MGIPSSNGLGENGFDPSLNKEEQEKAKELAAVRAPILHEVVRREGQEELQRSAFGLGWSGLAAGLSMGFSMVSEGLLRAHLPVDSTWTPLISKVGYSVGFVLVIMGKQQLYTENTLTPVVPFMSHPTGKSFAKLLRLWGIVLLANLVGALAFAWACGQTQIFDPVTKGHFTQLGFEALGDQFGLTFLKGIFGGWLIAMIGWILGGQRSDGMGTIFLLSYIVGIGHFSHIVAGSVDTLYLVVTGSLSWGGYFWKFMLPALLGNTVGGVAMVALVNHAQVAAGRKNRLEKNSQSSDIGLQKKQEARR